MSLGDRIREARKNKNLTQEQLGSLIGCLLYTSFAPQHIEHRDLLLHQAITNCCADVRFPAPHRAAQVKPSGGILCVFLCAALNFSLPGLLRLIVLKIVPIQHILQAAFDDPIHGIPDFPAFAPHNHLFAVYDFRVIAAIPALWAIVAGQRADSLVVCFHPKLHQPFFSLTDRFL